MFLLFLVGTAFLFGSGQTELLETPLSLEKEDLIAELISQDLSIPENPTTPNLLLALYGSLERLQETSLSCTHLSCLVGFAKLDFQFGEFDKYPVYYNENSVIQLAQAGAYKGPENIEEYVRFTHLGPFFASAETDSRQRWYLGWEGEERECKFLEYSKRSFQTQKPLFEAFFAMVSMKKLTYLPKTNKLSEVFIHFGEDSLLFFFESIVNTQDMQEYICKTMLNDCPYIWDLNGYSKSRLAPQGMKQCLDDLNQLPIVEEGADITGKSLGCRALHSVFASVNAGHCPHISFFPTADEKGVTKCQDASFIQPANLFSREDLEGYLDFAQEVGAPAGTSLILPKILCEAGNLDCPVGFTCETKNDSKNLKGFCVQIEEGANVALSSYSWSRLSLSLWVISLAIFGIFREVY